jgi:ribonucleoside-diphosphate reductase alpha chain
MKAVVNDRFYWLKDNKGKNVQHVRAREVFDFICGNAWESGDPGLLFIDEINRKHPLKKVGKVEATNPCGEVILLPNEACCLGSVNLAHMVRNNAVNWVKLAKTVKTGVRFLDNMITLNNYPTKDIKKICLSNRKIGLGVMGWANMLVSLNLKYDSSEALAMAKKVATFIRKTAEEESEKLAREKGAFPNQKNSTIKNKRRNATILSISPTGSISIIAGCSSGIEPLFGIAYVRNIVDGMQLFEVNPAFEQVARYRGFYSKGLMTKISHLGSIQDIKKIPKDVQDLFVTALDIPVESHVKMQAVFQSQIDNAVSKTVNLPTNAIIGDIKRTYMLAWKEKCKGITVYRYGSKGEQVLYIGAHDKKGKKSMPHTKVHAEYSGGHISKTCEY